MRLRQLSSLWQISLLSLSLWEDTHTQAFPNFFQPQSPCLLVTATVLSFFSQQATAGETQLSIWMEQVPPSPLLVPFTPIPEAQPEPSESWQKLLPWNNIPNPLLSLSSLSPFLWNCGKSKSEPVYPHLWIPKMRSPHSSLSGSGSLSQSGPRRALSFLFCGLQ